ncbi:MAG: hypothetical protein HY348_03515 [Nitrospira defluvii]|nr:hypothetical protein [Nitrospira defluvii]
MSHVMLGDVTSSLDGNITMPLFQITKHENGVARRLGQGMPGDTPID